MSDYERPSVGRIDGEGLTGPPTRDGCLYLATRLQRLGVKDRLRSIHQTPEDAYQAVVKHAGDEPEDYIPEFPEGNWGREVWGWHTEDGATYLIQQFRWSGLNHYEVEFPDNAIPDEESGRYSSVNDRR